MLSLRTRRGPVMGSLKTPGKTVFPCQGTSFAMPTLTDSRVPAGPLPVRRWSVCGHTEPIAAEYLASPGAIKARPRLASGDARAAEGLSDRSRQRGGDHRIRLAD